MPRRAAGHSHCLILSEVDGEAASALLAVPGGLTRGAVSADGIHRSAAWAAITVNVSVFALPTAADIFHFMIFYFFFFHDSFSSPVYSDSVTPS